MSKCVSGDMHWWSHWHLISDPINIDDGSTGGYVYVSECTVMGCSTRRKVKQLVPLDEPIIYQEDKNA